ncbi:alpha/beta hydrolase [Rhizobium azibense]|uniref:Alpha/beta hydrolase family protein n=1 Tax=Rhizobium azibense TaxID=1136135 RepID=A0A4R3RXF4_9HYPH|nr:alpha/beta hydrolase family protein [Rhizobium azibense]
MLAAVIDFRNARDDRLDRTLRQCIIATEWLTDHLADFGADRILIGGKSSGAHLGCEALLHLRSVGKISRVARFYSMCGVFDLDASRSLRKVSRCSLLIDGPAAIKNLHRLTLPFPAT